jgi:hypothetical protein
MNNMLKCKSFRASALYLNGIDVTELRVHVTQAFCCFYVVQATPAKFCLNINESIVNITNSMFICYMF